MENLQHQTTVLVPNGNMLVRCDPSRVTHEQTLARAQLAAQAPAMARLLASLQSVPTHDSRYLYECVSCRGGPEERADDEPTTIRHAPNCELVAVLMAAGVLP